MHIDKSSSIYIRPRAGPPPIVLQSNGHTERNGSRHFLDESVEIQPAPFAMDDSFPTPGKLRVGIWLPIWLCGGVERYHLALAKWTSPAIEWVGCALMGGAYTYQETVDELCRVMPIYATVHLSEIGVDATRNIIRCPDTASALAQVVRHCQVLIVWGIADMQPLLDLKYSGRVVVLQHGENDWARNWAKGAMRFPGAVPIGVSQRAARLMDQLQEQTVGKGCTPAASIPAGVELDRLAPSQSREESRKRLGIQCDEIAIGYVGRFSDEKNPLMAARVVGALGHGYRAVYHGHSPWDETHTRSEVRKISGDRCGFAGREWHTGDIYAAIDLLLVASYSEAGPLVAIEAWLTGVPLISTPVGLVRREWATIVENPRDVGGFVSAVRQVSNQLPRNPSLVRPVHREALETFSAPAMARRWESWLFKLCGDR